MEKRRYNRRDDDNRSDRSNRRTRSNSNDKGQHRSDRDKRHRYDDHDEYRRRAPRDENWFDIDPSETQYFASSDDRPQRNERRESAKNNNRRIRNNGDKHDKYRDHRRNNSYNDYQNDFDDDTDYDFNYQPKSRRERHNDRNSRPQRTPRKHDNNNTAKNKNDDTTRLNKYIANAGICSRREADVLIASGAVTVNGEVITQLGYKVKAGDVVHYGGEKLVSERKRYILLNKPKGYITTMDDPQERKTVMSLVADACPERIYPVGRLDRNTTGLLLFTNDGELAKKLTHPSSGARKIYNVELDKPLSANDRRRMLEGISLEDGDISVDAVEYGTDNRTVVGVELHSGRNRIVRRIFESMGYEVYKLDRVLFAELTKKNLPRGHWRELTQKEVGFLKMV